MDNPIIKQRESCSVIYVSEYGGYEHSELKAWQKLTSILNGNNEEHETTLFFSSELLGFCHHDPESTPTDEIRYDAAISCSSDILEEFKLKGCESRDIPAGKFASITYKGDSQAKNAWKDLYSWVLEENLECKDVPAFEKYTNWSYGMDYEDLIVEVYVPLK